MFKQLGWSPQHEITESGRYNAIKPRKDKHMIRFYALHIFLDGKNKNFACREFNGLLVSAEWNRTHSLFYKSATKYIGTGTALGPRNQV